MELFVIVCLWHSRFVSLCLFIALHIMYFSSSVLLLSLYIDILQWIILQFCIDILQWRMRGKDKIGRS